MRSLFFSWKTSLIGLVSVVYGVLIMFNEPSIHAALHDQKLGYALLVALLGFVAKDSTAHGTPSNPLPNPAPPPPQHPPVH